MSACFTPRKTLVPAEQEDGWAPADLTFSRKEKSLSPARIGTPDHAAHSQLYYAMLFWFSGLTKPF